MHESAALRAPAGRLILQAPLIIVIRRVHSPKIGCFWPLAFFYFFAVINREIMLPKNFGAFENL